MKIKKEHAAGICKHISSHRMTIDRKFTTDKEFP